MLRNRGKRSQKHDTVELEEIVYSHGDRSPRWKRMWMLRHYRRIDAAILKRIVTFVQYRASRSSKKVLNGDLARLRVRQDAAVFEEERRQRVARDARGLEEGLRVRIPLDVEPAVRDQVAREKVLHLVRSRRPLMADEAELTWPPNEISKTSSGRSNSHGLPNDSQSSGNSS